MVVYAVNLCGFLFDYYTRAQNLIKKINHLKVLPSTLSSTLFLSQALFLIFCLILTPSLFLLLLDCPPAPHATPPLGGIFGVVGGAILNPL